MKPKIWIFILFLALGAAQLYVPGSIIMRHEKILTQGTSYKFRARPVDPYDVFRGRYVALAYDDATTVPLSGQEYERGETLYAVIGTMPDGFAKLEGVSRRPPEEGDYVKVRMNWLHRGVGHLRLPFDRFYMEENLAREAESIYREHARRDVRDAHSLVRVLDGGAVIEDVIVGDQSISEAARQALEAEEEKEGE